MINKIELGRILVIREKGRGSSVAAQVLVHAAGPGGWRRAAGKTCDTSLGTDT